MGRRPKNPPQELANLLTCNTHTLHQITTGHQPITKEIAAQLEHATSIPARAWLRCEQVYRADLDRLSGSGKSE